MIRIQRIFKYIAYSIGISLPLIYLLSLFGESRNSLTLRIPQSGLSTQRNKLILLWTPSWDPRTQPISGWDITKETLKECPFKCDFTRDQSLLAISDSLVYHGVYWNTWERLKSKLLNKLPNRGEKNWDQLWTFLRVEPPTTSDSDFHDLNNKFNWTATYRLDSDLPYRYGTFEVLAHGEMEFGLPSLESLSSKNLIGWMNSHCSTPSRRENLVEELEKHIPIDVYGSCGDLGELPCQGTDFCYESLAQKYMFWLVFENSLCPDYLSEKFYIALKHGMVPIVYAHPSFVNSVPNGSFIDASSFENMKELANYIMFLDGNPSEYHKYFEWRKYYRVNQNLDKNFWCSYCTKLNTLNGDMRYIIGSIHDWWYNKSSACVNPTSDSEILHLT